MVVPLVRPDDYDTPVFKAFQIVEIRVRTLAKLPAEVDAVMERGKKAGAVITKQAQRAFWGGYAGYFQDPDGHLWEVVWNPQMEIVDEV